MSMVRRDPAPRAAATPTAWDPFRMLRELSRWDPFHELPPPFPADSREMLFMPDIDVKETPEAYVFKADLPGVKEKDLEISLHGNRLTLSGKREEEKREERSTFYSCERSYGAFTRSFVLPDSADAEQVKAELREGVLTVSIGKKPGAQPKKVPVQATEKKA